MENPYSSLPAFVMRESVPVADYEARKARSAAVMNEAAATGGVPTDVALFLTLDRLFPPIPDDTAEEEAVLVATAEEPTKLQVIQLQEELEQRCADQKARTLGVCSVRESIYNSCLDEIIRQATVACPERGALLAELRDEVGETQATFDTLFDASCQYGARKTIERDLKRTMQAQLEQLSKEAAILENRVNEMKAKHEGLEKRFAERRQAEEKKHAEEVTFLKRGNTQLTNELKRLTM